VNRVPPTLRSQPDQANQPSGLGSSETGQNDDEAARNDHEDDASQEQDREEDQDRRIEK
jgi:hypothetical protein